jgi:hypothetical protein
MIYSGNLEIFSDKMFQADINFKQFLYQKYM